MRMPTKMVDHLLKTGGVTRLNEEVKKQEQHWTVNNYGVEGLKVDITPEVRNWVLNKYGKRGLDVVMTEMGDDEVTKETVKVKLGTKTNLTKETKQYVMNNYGPRGLEQVYNLIRTTDWDMKTILDTVEKWEGVLNDGYDLHESTRKVGKVKTDTIDKKGNDKVVTRTTVINKEKRPTCKTLTVLHKHVRKNGNGLKSDTDGHRDEWTQERTMMDKHKTGVDPDDLVQQGMYHTWVREMRQMNKTTEYMEEGIKTLMENMGRYNTEYVRELNKVETNDDNPMVYMFGTVTRLYTREKDRVLTDVKNKNLPIDDVDWEVVVDNHEGQTPVDEVTMEKLTKLLLGNMKEKDIDLWLMKTRGVSDKEIGEVLGTTQQYVWVKLNRMRKRLLKTLQDLGGMETLTHMEL